MRTAQERTMQEIERILTERGYSVAQASQYANTGYVYVYVDYVPEAIASIRYDFQTDTYKLTLTANGRKVPSQVGRADYFDFYQSYTEPTRFWEELANHLPPLKRHKATA